MKAACDLTSSRARRRRLTAQLGTALLFLAQPAAAYEALVGWLPVSGADGYLLSVGIDGQPSDAVDVGAVAPEIDGVCRVVVTDLPLGPTATFFVASYDEQAGQSLPSNSLRIEYRDAANVLDSDGDGLTDAQEDADLDKIVDTDETDPNDPDSDGDGMSDGDEIIAGFDPNDDRSPGPACDADACDDGNACNGIERCEIGIGCIRGAALVCDNGVYCDGAERCEPMSGCVSGSAPNCDDGISCTEDLCDPSADACTNIARAERCNDGDVCTDDSCSTIAGCTTAPNTAACDDGRSCTSDDACSDGLCSGVSACNEGEICGPTSGACESATTDSDNDGLVNREDPCPGDARNICFGQVALDRSRGSIVRINSNPSDAECAGYRTDCAGNVWVADFGYDTSARPRSCNRRHDAWQCEIQGVQELFGCDSESTRDLFRCAQSDWGVGAPSSYSFDVPAGRYLLNLYFANVRPNGDAVGARIFDIEVEGKTAYESFDPVAQAGGTQTAIVRSIMVELSDDNGLQIGFRPIQGKTTINAIELLGPAS